MLCLLEATVDVAYGRRRTWLQKHRRFLQAAVADVVVLALLLVQLGVGVSSGVAWGCGFVVSGGCWGCRIRAANVVVVVVEGVVLLVAAAVTSPDDSTGVRVRCR